jgi:hypothetical protein
LAAFFIFKLSQGEIMAEDNDNKPNPVEAFQNLLGKYNNDGVKLASQLFDENYQYRNQIRDLKATAPKEGTVTLNADEAKLWKAYQDLGVEPEKIKESLERVPVLETENSKLTKRDKLREIETLGYDLEVLEDRMSAFPNAEITVKKSKDAKDATKEVKTPYVTLDGKESSLDDFAQANFAKFLPVLKVNAEQPIRTGSTPDPKPSKATTEEVMQREIAAQAASGRYTL